MGREATLKRIVDGGIVAVVRSESSATSGSDDQPPLVKLYVRISIVQDPFVRLARSIGETDCRHDLVDARARLGRERGIEQRHEGACVRAACSVSAS